MTIFGRRPSRGLVLVLTLALLAPLAWWTVHATTGTSATRDPSPPTHSFRRAPVSLPEGIITATTSKTVNLIATLPGDEQGFAAPNGEPTQIVPGSWHGGVSALPVIAVTDGWYQVELAQRPNESTTWIRSQGVALSTTPYRIVINLSTKHLELFDQGTVELDAPAGIGTPEDPTPPGNYFVAFFAQAPSPGYGPWVVVTSAHSDTISDFEDSGDAIIAIHGPLGADAAIGTSGAAISHGCVRLHDDDLVRLGVVPAGTPIDIVA